MATVQRRFRCEGCGRRLGLYAVDPGLGEIWDPVAAEVVPVRLPKGMVIWDGTQPRPPLFFRVESASFERGSRTEQHGPIFRSVEGVKYRWRCGCGRSPVYLPGTLAEKLQRTGDVYL